MAGLPGLSFCHRVTSGVTKWPADARWPARLEGGGTGEALKAHQRANLRRDQRGITGLETAIVLIAFVVVASVFAFAVLSTGLLSSEKSKETVLGSLEETSATLTLRGAVIADANAGKTAIDDVTFTLTSAAQTAEAVDLSSAGTVVTYLDADQAINCTGSGTPSCSWATNWIIGSGNLVDPNEQVDVTVTISSISTLLGTSKEFTIQIKPNRGAIVIVNRTTPPEFKAINDLN